MKQLSKKQKFVFIAGVLAVVAFIFSFIVPLKAEMSFLGTTITENASFGDTFFGEEGVGGALVSFFGLVLILAAGAYLIVSCFKEVKVDNVLKLVAIGALVVGAVLVFMTETFYLASIEIPEGTPAEYIEKMKTEQAEMLKLGFGSIVCGILAIASAALVAFSKFFVKED